MRKIMVNWILIALSIFLIIVGFFKLFNGFESYTISFGSNYVNIPNSTSLLYILMVNFIGGYSVLYYSFKTIKFQKAGNKNLTGLSTLDIITGYYSLLIALIMLVKLLVLLLGFGSDFFNYFMLLLIVVCINIIYPILIIVLVSKTTKKP